MPKTRKINKIKAKRKESQLNFYDITLYHDELQNPVFRNAFISKLHEWCKKFVFQLERGDQGRLHYQGRISLISKRQITRLKGMWKQDPLLKPVHISITSNEGTKTFSYVMKADSRVDGPWTDKDVPVEIFLQHQVPSLRPWQQSIKDKCQIFEKRIVNLVVDPTGKIGKSTLVANLITDPKIFEIFPMKEPKDLMRMVMNVLGDEKYPKAIFIDIPRSASKALGPLFAACEMVKEGKCYDDRYNFKVHRFQSPSVWITMNWKPDPKYLSQDRWKIWNIADNLLVPQV